MIRFVCPILLLFACWAGLGQSQYAVRRSCYSTYNSYPNYSYPNYSYYSYPNYRYYPVTVEIQKDYYFSIDSYYRDKLLVDALEGRMRRIIMEGQRPPQQQQQQQIPQQQQQQATLVPQGLKAVVDAKCIKCHTQSSPERVNLTNLAVVNAGLRWHAHGLVNSGEMPKGGQQLKDEEVLQFYEWAKLGSKKGGK